jgi:hypothetical protein
LVFCILHYETFELITNFKYLIVIHFNDFVNNYSLTIINFHMEQYSKNIILNNNYDSVMPSHPFTIIMIQ